MANPVATFETSEGSFKAEIFLAEMPITAQNFISLARSPWPTPAVPTAAARSSS